MRRKTIGSLVAVAAVGALAGVALASGGEPAGGSRLDDGRGLLPQASITEQQAVAAAQRAASGALNEVDLEQHEGRLVFNVDVGDRDVKVDADSGAVLGAPSDEDSAGSDD